MYPSVECESDGGAVVGEISREDTLGSFFEESDGGGFVVGPDEPRTSLLDVFIFESRVFGRGCRIDEYVEKRYSCDVGLESCVGESECRAPFAGESFFCKVVGFVEKSCARGGEFVVVSSRKNRCEAGIGQSVGPYVVLVDAREAKQCGCLIVECQSFL